MATTTNNRRDAIYAAISAQANFTHLSQAEQAQVKASIGTIFGADLAYLVSAVTVLPTNLYDNAGATVTTAMGPGSVSSTSSIGGTGTIS